MGTGARVTPINDLTHVSTSKAVSTSTGTVKATSGALFVIFCTTSGSFDLKDGNTVIANISTSAGAVYNFWPGIPFSTTISLSASAFVGTLVYK